jgi:hypothetical protein
MIRVDDDALEAMVNAFLNLIERDLNLNAPPGVHLLSPTLGGRSLSLDRLFQEWIA